jgi:hypothetical protein
LDWNSFGLIVWPLKVREPRSIVAGRRTAHARKDKRIPLQEWEKCFRTLREAEQEIMAKDNKANKLESI